MEFGLGIKERKPFEKASSSGHTVRGSSVGTDTAGGRQASLFFWVNFTRSGKKA